MGSTVITTVQATGGTTYTPRGTWASGTAYAINDLTLYNGSTYLVTTGHTASAGATPDITPANYLLFAQGGAAGTPGTPGTVFTPRGSWTSSTAYAVNDLVLYNGSTYRIITAHTSTAGATPDITTANYALFAQAGTPGTSGTVFTQRGAWAAGTAYAVNDMVQYSGSTYVVATAHTAAAGNPPTVNSPAYYTVFALAGTSGTSGTVFTQRGTWAASTAYAVNDMVQYLGSTYLVVTAHTSAAGNPPTTNSPAYYSVFAQAGTSGTSGTVFNQRGAWAYSTSYAANDMVQYNGSTYLVNTAHTTGTGPSSFPPNNSNYTLFAKAGLDGASSTYVQRGAWVAGVFYYVNDMVLYNGSTYLVITAHNSVAGSPPSTTPANYSLFAQGIPDGTVPVYKGTTAPTDTTGVWVDTT